MSFEIGESKDGKDTTVTVKMEWRVKGGAEGMAARRLLIHVRSMVQHTFEAISQLLTMAGMIDGKHVVVKEMTDEDERKLSGED